MPPAAPPCAPSLRTTLCLRFKPHIIACGAIFYAARRLGVALPEEPPWWGVFGVEEAGMYEVVRVMHDLYQRPRAEHIPVFRHIVPSKPPTPVLSPAPGAAGGGGSAERGGGGGAPGAKRELVMGAAPPRVPTMISAGGAAPAPAPAPADGRAAAAAAAAAGTAAPEVGGAYGDDKQGWVCACASATLVCERRGR
jgi:hypothetical protein